jgi:anti-anti-sigma regulatory factor
MDIIRNDRHELPVLCVYGALVGRNWPVFLTALRMAVAEGHSGLAIDLGQVTRMGQAEASCLLDTRDSLARRSCRLDLVGLSPAVITAMGQEARYRRTLARRRMQSSAE